VWAAGCPNESLLDPSEGSIVRVAHYRRLIIAILCGLWLSISLHALGHALHGEHGDGAAGNQECPVCQFLEGSPLAFASAALYLAAADVAESLTGGYQAPRSTAVPLDCTCRAPPGVCAYA
jgi:hypothetical protein